MLSDGTRCPKRAIIKLEFPYGVPSFNCYELHNSFSQWPNVLTREVEAGKIYF